jgi:hypothetical protein
LKNKTAQKIAPCALIGTTISVLNALNNTLRGLN